MHLFIDGTDLRQSQSRDEGADQAGSRQIDSFAKRAAQHRESNTMPVRGEASQEAVSLGLGHAPLLTPYRNFRMTLREPGGYLLQVVEAAEEGEIVAGV